MSHTPKPFQFEQLLHSPIARLRLIGKIEGATLILLLFIAVPLKHIFELPIGVQFMGPLHGIAFLSYLIVLIECISGGGFSKREICRLSIVVIIPFGPFFNEQFLKNHQSNRQIS
ncbi:DUF3817 domain-containing protein [Ningiella sp. W23]|uniref:DUF3817 domain-containing protein n=1 Tax=Ningiella sp. W23 TaxID=3023715 RepID=UPI003757ECF0